MKKIILYILLVNFAIMQDPITEYLIIDADTVDVFSYLIPENYNENESHPLLVAFHQWGGNENSNYFTEFDEECNNRNWIMLSPYGGSANNYNHQGAQYLVENEILWMIENFNINTNKIYMVGGSMGGAAGAIYANNHLDPTKPMVAATASASGILDCERRAVEMDGNNSMIEWFGGDYDEVPFEYHRNSAIYFADSTQSMHYNLRHTPLYLDFGVSEPHRTHAEELYDILLGYNVSMWIDEDPTGSHGYPVFDEVHVCNWLDQFELNNNPTYTNVNLDEPSRAYLVEAKNQSITDEFIRIEGFFSDSNVVINQFKNSDTLIIHILNDTIPSVIPINNNQSNSIFTLGITGISEMISEVSEVLFEGYDNSSWDNLNQENEIIYVDISTGIYSMFFSFVEPDDVNQDGIWNVIDIILIMNHILNVNLLDDIQLLYADINNDGIVDILDIVYLVNLILSE